MSRFVAWLGVAVALGLGGAGSLVLGASRLGEWVYAGQRPSVLTILLPLVAAAILDAASVAAGGLAGVELSVQLRRRSLNHALNIDPDRVETLGVGRTLALALDADLVGSVLVTAAPAAILGVIELGFGAVISARTPDGIWRLLVILGALAVLAGAARFLVATGRHWTRDRESLTSRLTERLVGQRTVALQEQGPAAQTEISSTLRHYRAVSRRFDVATIAVSAIGVAAGTALVALGLGLHPTGAAPSDVALAIGAALLATSGLLRLGRVVSQFASAWVAHEQITRLRALRRAPETGSSAPGGEPTEGSAIVSARGVRAGYTDAVVGPVDLSVRRDDRVLLTGPSGCGKTTLVEVLAGRREALSGTVDREPGVQIVRAPQSGDDHVFHASLMFNVLLGRAWPPDQQDVDAAEEVLVDLGLEPLLARMPAGILQPIGDGGWRLSAGESARVRLARALVRRPDLVVLDESFAALDAATFDMALAAAEKWAGALLVVAHP